MALLFMDSFDHYATADITEKWTAVTTCVRGNGIAPTIGAYGRNSTQGLRTKVATGGTDTAVGPTVTVAPSDAVCIVGLAVKYSSISDLAVSVAAQEGYTTGREGSNYIVRCFKNNDALWWARVNTDGTISVLTDLGDDENPLSIPLCPVLGTTTNSLQAGVFAYVEIKVTVQDPTGTVDVRINGLSGLSLTGQNTRGTGFTSGWTNVRVGYHTYNTPDNQTLHIDDLVIMDGSGARNNDFLGDVTISAIYPDGAGTTTEWTPSAGVNFENVDEALVNDDTDYNSTNVLNAKDTYSMEDVATGANIKAIQIVTSQRKVAEGPGKIKHVVRSNSTDYDQTEQGIGGTTYSYLRSIVETDPATGVAWDEAGFNAVEIGLKKTG